MNTNTPLQALVTLNDPSYLEAAQHFALLIQKEAGAPDVKTLIETGYHLTTGQAIAENKSAVLQSLIRRSSPGCFCHLDGRRGG